MTCELEQTIVKEKIKLVDYSLTTKESIDNEVIPI